MSPVEVSEREAEVLDAVGRHLTNTQIASRLHISVRTVESHVSSLLRKYGVTNRRELAILASEQQQRGEHGEPGEGAATVAGLPAARTSFIGRGDELAEIAAAAGRSRLVTLLGPGGVGKSRLVAVAAAASRQGGVFVDLVPVRDGFVEHAVAAALGVTERPQTELHTVIIERLGRSRTLVVLDNCEHLLDAVAGFADRILAACPGTRILATSRERLGVPGERIVRVGPLPLSSHAEALFTDRALAADPGFAAEPGAVAEICARLDGMPLAIELAAARSAALGASGVLAALDDRLRLLAGGRGADERHRSLRAVLSWSHDLLDEEERGLFRRLAVFAGGFDLDAVLAVTRGTVAGATAVRATGSAAGAAGVTDAAAGVVVDVLGRLVDKSLVVKAGAGRWRLLETVRAFAGEQLALGGEEAAVRDLHLAWAAKVAADLVARGGEGREFDVVADDLRAALAAAPAEAGDVAHGLARSLGRLAYARRFAREAYGHFLEASERAGSPGEASKDIKSAADCTHVLPTGGHRHFELLCSAAEQARDAADGDAEAVLLATAVVTTARNPGWGLIPHEELRRLLERAADAGDPGDPVVAAWLAAARAWTASAEPYSTDPDRAEEAVAAARAAGDPVLLSAGLDATVAAALHEGRLRDAHRIAMSRLDLLDVLPRDDPASAVEIVDIVHVAVNCATAAGDLPAALAVARRALADDLLEDQYHLSSNIIILPLALSGEFGEALRYADEAWDSWVRTGRLESGFMLPVAVGPALVHGLRGDRGRYVEWRSRTSGAPTGQVFDLPTLVGFADALVAVHTGRFDSAADLVAGLFSDATLPMYAGFSHAAGAELAVVAGLPDAAARVDAAEAAAAENAWGAACLARARGRLHDDPGELAASVESWERIGARFERASTLLLLPDRAEEGRAELATLTGKECE
ncbi:LuxR C-terminal-related transcriptional regulator [Actinomadura sp. 3N508]|uniref:LuxR C-terminal-related transcriptional regulator n=1 Tax=Actinomadura sp. 3N508 TaxID=3375153 RepID=UPI0037A40E03